MKKIKFYWFLIPILLLGIGVLCGSFWDYEIDEALFHKNQIVCIILAAVGELPAYAGVAFCGGVLFFLAGKYIKCIWGRICAQILSFGPLAFGVYYQGKAFASVNAFGALSDVIRGNWLIRLPAGLLLVVPFFFLGLFIAKHHEFKYMFETTIAMLLCLFFPLAVITVLKELFHRPRFRYIVESGEELFRKVFEPFENYAQIKNLENYSLIKEEFRSFPSGHTGSAMCLAIWAIYLPEWLPQLQEKRGLLFGCGVLYGCIIALSRMILGAHFLSDVSFGGLLTLVGLLGGTFILIVYLKWREKRS